MESGMGDSYRFTVARKHYHSAPWSSIPLHRGAPGIQVGEAEAVIARLGVQALIKTRVELEVAYS